MMINNNNVVQYNQIKNSDKNYSMRTILIPYK